MAAGIKFYSFVYKLGRKTIDLENDDLCIYLSNSAPDIANDTVKADVPEITVEHGYDGPISLNCSWAQSGGGISTLTGDATTTITAAGGSIGPFRYVILFDNTVAGGPLIAYWDYGAPLTLADGAVFRFNLDDPPTVVFNLQ